MAWEELGREAERENSRRRDKLIGVYIGILAVVLAISSLGGNNADQDATQQNIAASNIWGFFQAKNARRQALAAPRRRIRHDAEVDTRDAG